MGKVKHYTQLIVFDALAVVCMIAALLTGWLPGPGGIPLFLVGLSLLAINHEWTQRYIDMLKKYADRLGDIIFIPRLRLMFDILAPILFALGVWLLVDQSVWWMLPLGTFSIGMSIITFFGNRNRWKNLKKKISDKR